MALSVQTNNAAMTALKHLNANNAAMNSSLERLSSGFRINNAADDASGFAVSSKLDAQTERLKAASQNATNAQAMVKMADAGVNEIQNMVVRIQTLAVQASSANSAGELGKLDAERIKLEDAITKIANSTNFNGVNLLNGSGSAGGTGGAVGTPAAGTNTGVSTTSLVTASTTNANATYTLTADATGNLTINNGVSNVGTLAFSAGATQTVNLSDGAVISVTFANAAAGTGGETSTLVVSGQEVFTQGVAGNAAAFTASTVSNAGTNANTGYTFTETAVAGVSSQVTITNTATTAVVGVVDITANIASSQTVNLSDGNAINFTYDGSAIAVAAATAAGTLTVGASTAGGAGGGGSVFQVGADNNTANQVSVDLSQSYTAAALGLGTGDLTTQANAQAYIDTSKAALNTVVLNRADLGATQNQVAFIQANLATSIEQSTASVSAIRDADMAAEMAEFTKNQILTQASTAMLAQANQAAQNVMSLFR